jgi:vacuolar-type H+-ATPase subunit D/Vma8
MKHLSRGYIFNGKPIPKTSMEVKGINQRMTDAADGNTTRPRMLKKNKEESEF